MNRRAPGTASASAAPTHSPQVFALYEVPSRSRRAWYTVLSSTVSSRSRTTAVGRRASTSSATLHCSSAALPREGAAMRSSASWYTCSVMARYSGATCIHNVACRLSRPASGVLAAPATADAMKLATATNEPRPMNPPNLNVQQIGLEYFRANRFQRVGWRFPSSTRADPTVQRADNAARRRRGKAWRTGIPAPGCNPCCAGFPAAARSRCPRRRP